MLSSVSQIYIRPCWLIKINIKLHNFVFVFTSFRDFRVAVTPRTCNRRTPIQSRNPCSCLCCLLFPNSFCLSLVEMEAPFKASLSVILLCQMTPSCIPPTNTDCKKKREGTDSKDYLSSSWSQSSWNRCTREGVFLLPSLPPLLLSVSSSLYPSLCLLQLCRDVSTPAETFANALLLGD